MKPQASPRSRRCRTATPAILLLTLAVSCSSSSAPAPGSGAVEESIAVTAAAGAALPVDAARDDAPAAASPSSSTPAELVGAWKYGVASFTNFFGSQGQHLGSGGGTSVRFTFDASGRFTQQVFLSRRNYGNLIETWTEAAGTVVFGGNQFTIRPATGRYKASDSAIARNNFDRAMTDKERQDYVRTFHWKFEVNPNDGKRYLMISFDQNSWSHFAAD